MKKGIHSYIGIYSFPWVSVAGCKNIDLRTMMKITIKIIDNEINNEKYEFPYGPMGLVSLLL